MKVLARVAVAGVCLAARLAAGGTAAPAELVKQLGAKYLSDREAAAAALAALPPEKLKELVPDIVALVETGNWIGQSGGAALLKKIGPAAREAGPRLAKLVPDGVAKRRRAFVCLMIETVAAVDPASAELAVCAITGRSAPRRRAPCPCWRNSSPTATSPKP